MSSSTESALSPPSLGHANAEQEEERRKLRRLQIMVGMAASVLNQAAGLAPHECQEVIANCKAVALAMFPGKELAFDLIYKPRLERIVEERFNHAGFHRDSLRGQADRQ